MIFIIKVRLPMDKSMEYVKVSSKIPKLPATIKKWDAYTTPDGYGNYKQYHVIKTDREKSEEALIDIVSRMNPVSEIEGFTWKIVPCLGTTDAFKAGKIPRE